ncbi:MAG: HAMP domain-containing histidine kinase [Clostridia bacterium]|nr:HAMP domain-containing histidine kinase [Clostridia bacterium]
MKLSFKFFCIAYIIVLLSMGFGGIFLIKNVTDTVWDSRVEQVNSAANYAADSFMAFADISYGGITGSRKNDIIRQIKNTLNSAVSDVQIYSTKTVENEYTKLQDGEGISRFVNEDSAIIMKSVCRLSAGTDVYYLAVLSDFTETQKHCQTFWNGYSLVIFSISVISGLALFVLAKKVTRPLNQLAKATDQIALGKWGETVNIKSSDYEISDLSQSFNKMSRAIQEKISELKEETQKRDIFVADFTHELKTPMTAIMGYAQMLNSYVLDEQERKEAAESIYNEAKRLESLSRQLLDLYVMQNEMVEMEIIRLFNVGGQLKATLKFLSEKYNVAFTVNFDDEMVCANSVMLLSLLYNLADNAFKAVSEGGCVKIYSKSQTDVVHIFVEDNGRGIAKENIKMLTEPFYREDKSRSRKLGGAGLGLSLCKEIAALHGTELCFESERGKGTVVSFTLKKGGNSNE